MSVMTNVCKSRSTDVLSPEPCVAPLPEPNRNALDALDALDAPLAPALRNPRLRVKVR